MEIFDFTDLRNGNLMNENAGFIFYYFFFKFMGYFKQQPQCMITKFCQ